MIPEDSNKENALAYARRGWAVFPIKPKDKTPATRNGFKDASSDPATVETMFSAGNGLNIGIATGPESGLWVLDLDGEEGIEALNRLEDEYGKLPKTITVRTGGGGRHQYFALGGEPIRNRAKVGGMPIDVRGDGGYVVAPPSRHKSGDLYQWEVGPDEADLVEAPDWLVDLVLDRQPKDLSYLLRNDGMTFVVGGIDEDLATASGAGKGKRHDTALRLIGSEIGRGTDPVKVANLAVQWARRCSPPMQDKEVLRIVSDLAKKETVKIETELDEIEREELPPAPDWPVLADEAYHGLAGEIVRTIEPETEADPVGLLVHVLVMFGSLVGRFAHFTVEGTRHFANLFAVLVGVTAKGRKGTSEGRVRELFRLTDEDWTLDNIKTGLVSGEGLIWNVRDPIYKIENIKEKGRIVGTEEVLADPGMEDKRLLVIETEFASVLRVARREQNTLSPTLRSAWDSGMLRTLAKNSPAKGTDAHISIVGHITQEELRRTLAEIENFSGFSNRFLWLLVRRSKFLPDGGQDLDLDQYADRLRQAAEQAHKFARMRRDDQAARLWREIYPDLSSGSGGLLGAVTSRSEAQVLRLSITYALLDSSPVIRTEHLQAALAVWRYCHKSAEIIFGNSTGDPLADKLLELIRDNPGLGRTDMHRHLRNHAKAKELVRALAELRDRGLAECRHEPTGGRSAERWYPSEGSCEGSKKVPDSSDGDCERSETSEQSHDTDGDSSLSYLLRKSNADGMEELTI